VIRIVADANLLVSAVNAKDPTVRLRTRPANAFFAGRDNTAVARRTELRRGGSVSPF
jgi:hypothetical protein